LISALNITATGMRAQDGKSGRWSAPGACDIGAQIGATWPVLIGGIGCITAGEAEDQSRVTVVA
jgi:hypothetical protein